MTDKAKKIDVKSECFEKNSSIDIALYLNDLEGGGAERSMVILANGLSELGYSVEVVLNRLSGVYCKELNTSINVYSLDSRFRITNIWKLSKYLKKKRSRVLISTNVAPNYWGIMANIISGKHSKHILREPNTPHVEFRDASIKRKLGFFVARLLYGFADAWVGNSTSSVNSIRQFYKVDTKNVHLIYNAIPTDEIRSLAQESVSHRWIDNKEIKLIVTVGRVVRQKNHKMLIKALSYANENHKAKSYRLIIVGSRGLDKNCEDELNRLLIAHNLTDQVDFVNFTLNPFTYMFKADIFVLPSKWEGFPSVLAQSMACGSQVISTDCPGAAREILSDGKYGTLVPVDDWKAMGEAILSTQKNDFNSELVTERVREFSTEKNIISYHQLIQKVIQS